MLKKELNYIAPGEQKYISNGNYTFTVPTGVTKLAYGIAAKNGVSIINNNFKVGSTSVHFATNIYSNTVDNNNYSNYRISAAGDIVVIYTPGTTSGHNLKISRDKGATWELQNCSYAPNGIKMIWKNNVVVTPGQTFSVTLSGGDGHTIFRWGTGSSIKL